MTIYRELIEAFITTEEARIINMLRAKAACGHEARFTMTLPDGRDICTVCEWLAATEQAAKLAKKKEITK